MSSLVPILVRTFGRTGSTLLMQILGTNDQVCFERQYPFEHRFLTYVYRMSQVIALPGKQDNWDNDVLFQGSSPFISSLPYGKIESFDKQRFSQLAFVGLWEQLSVAMREKNGLRSDQTGFYAEKSPHQIADVANELLGGRNIYLLRDPRDEMVSIKSFNQKRGFHSFGWREDDTDITYAHKMCRNRRMFMQNMMKTKTDHHRINIRYEDLIRQGESEVARLSDWLGVELSFKKATNNTEIRDRHMTSTNYASSVERWKEELGHEVQEIFSRELGKELVELGYSV